MTMTTKPKTRKVQAASRVVLGLAATRAEVERHLRMSKAKSG